MGISYSYIWPTYYWNIDPLTIPMVGMFVGLGSFNAVALHVNIVLLTCITILNYIYASSPHIFNLFATLDFLHGRNFTCYDDSGKIPESLSLFTADDVATVFILYLCMLACALSFYSFRKYAIKFYYITLRKTKKMVPSSWNPNKNLEYYSMEWSWTGLAASLLVLIAGILFVALHQCFMMYEVVTLGYQVPAWAWPLIVDFIYLTIFCLLFGIVLFAVGFRSWELNWVYFEAMIGGDLDRNFWQFSVRIVLLFLWFWLIGVAYMIGYGINIHVPAPNGIQPHWTILGITIAHSIVSLFAAVLFYLSDHQLLSRDTVSGYNDNANYATLTKGDGFELEDEFKSKREISTK